MILRIGLSWVCYYAGDLISRPIGWRDHFCWLYPLYHRLMCWSYDLQGDNKRGPWSDEPINSDCPRQVTGEVRTLALPLREDRIRLRTVLRFTSPSHL